MADEWYYAHDGQPVGPFTLRDLKAGLAKVPDWQNVRVWRDGLDGWQRAGDLAEFAGPTVAPRAAPKRQDAQDRSPATDAKDQRSPKKQSSKRSMRKVLAGIVLLAVVIIAGVFGKFIARTVQGLGTRRPAVTVEAATDPTLEQRIAKSFEGFEATLPKKVDDVTTLVSAKHDGGTVTFSYRVDVDGSLLNDQVKAKVREIATKDICAEKRSREILDLGGSFHLDYIDKNGQPVTAVDVTKSNCS